MSPGKIQMQPVSLTRRSSTEYKSRREITYDDSHSESDESEDDNSAPKPKRRSMMLRKSSTIAASIVSVDGHVKVKHEPNSRFMNYKSVFSNMIKTTNIPTASAIVNCVISFDSTKSITITKKDENEYHIQ